MGSVRDGTLNGTFDGEGAKRKETSKDRQPKRQTQAKTDTNKNLEAERKSERGCRVNQQSTLVVV